MEALHQKHLCLWQPLIFLPWLMNGTPKSRFLRAVKKIEIHQTPTNSPVNAYNFIRQSDKVSLKPTTHATEKKKTDQSSISPLVKRSSAFNSCVQQWGATVPNVWCLGKAVYPHILMRAKQSFNRRVSLSPLNYDCSQNVEKLWFHEPSTIGGNINGNKTSWVYNLQIGQTTGAFNKNHVLNSIPSSTSGFLRFSGHSSRPSLESDIRSESMQSGMRCRKMLIFNGEEMGKTERNSVSHKSWIVMK